MEKARKALASKVQHEEAASPLPMCVDASRKVGLGAVWAISQGCWHSSPSATCY